MDIELMFAGPEKLKLSFKEPFYEVDGITDSISYCLKNFKCNKFKVILNNLIRPQYLQEYFDLMHDIIDLQ